MAPVRNGGDDRRGAVDSGVRNGFGTRAIHDGEGIDTATRVLNTPIYQTSTLAFESAADKEAAVDAAMNGDPEAYFYSRTSNPTSRALEVKPASLESADDAIVTGAGMSACATALLSMLNAGDHCTASPRQICSSSRRRCSTTSCATRGSR